MNRNLPTRIFEIPALLVCLMLMAGGLCANWYRVNSALMPPSLPRYDWNQHQQALLIAVPSDDCNCGASPSKWVRAGLDNGLDVVVATSESSPELNALQNSHLPLDRLTIITQVSPAIVQQLSPHQVTSGLRVHHGRIIGIAEGNLPPDDFWARM